MKAAMQVDAKAFNDAAAFLANGGYKVEAEKLVKHVLRLSANVVRENVRSAAASHRKTGELYRGVHTSWKGAGMSFILTVESTGLHAGFVTRGAKAHQEPDIIQKPMKLGPGTYRNAVRNPGFRPDPYFRRGIQRSLPPIQKLIDAAAETMVTNLASKMTTGRA